MTDIKVTQLNLYDYYGANRTVRRSSDFSEAVENPFYEPSLNRKYNHSMKSDSTAVRLVFLKTLEAFDPASARTLVKKGKPFWCYNFMYEGVDDGGFRQISFTISKKSKKRFCVGEQHILVVPTRVRIYPKFWDGYKQRCSNFGSLFAYQPIISLLYRKSEIFKSGGGMKDFSQRLRDDAPFKAGILVKPRLGLFYSSLRRSALIEDLRDKYQKAVFAGETISFEEWCRVAEETVVHPGVVISKGDDQDANLYGKEKYTVQFGRHTYEDIHPNELEILRSTNDEKI